MPRATENLENYRIRNKRRSEKIRAEGLKRAYFLIKPEWHEKIKKFIEKLKKSEKKT